MHFHPKISLSLDTFNSRELISGKTLVHIVLPTRKHKNKNVAAVAMISTSAVLHTASLKRVHGNGGRHCVPPENPRKVLARHDARLTATTTRSALLLLETNTSKLESVRPSERRMLGSGGADHGARAIAGGVYN